MTKFILIAGGAIILPTMPLLAHGNSSGGSTTGGTTSTSGLKTGTLVNVSILNAKAPTARSAISVSALNRTAQPKGRVVDVSVLNGYRMKSMGGTMPGTGTGSGSHGHDYGGITMGNLGRANLAIVRIGNAGLGHGSGPSAVKVSALNAHSGSAGRVANVSILNGTGPTGRSLVNVAALNGKAGNAGRVANVSVLNGSGSTGHSLVNVA